MHLAVLLLLSQGHILRCYCFCGSKKARCPFMTDQNLFYYYLFIPLLLFFFFLLYLAISLLLCSIRKYKSAI